MTLPIPLEIIQKESEIPQKIAQISETDQDKAIHYLRRWAIDKEPITTIYNEITKELGGAS